MYFARDRLKRLLSPNMVTIERQSLRNSEISALLRQEETAFYGELKPASGTFLGAVGWIVSHYVAPVAVSRAVWREQLPEQRSPVLLTAI